MLLLGSLYDTRARSIANNINRTFTVQTYQPQSLWHKTARIPSFEQLGNRKIVTDVCIVGGGIAGIVTAYNLMVEGKRVVVIEEREGIARGTSGSSPAHLASALDNRFYNIKQLHGMKGLQIVSKNYADALDMVEENIRREKIYCDYVKVDGYLFATTPTKDTYEELLQEVASARDAGHHGSRIVTTAPVPAIDTGPAVLFPHQAQFHPLKYLLSLLQAIVRKGGKIFTATRAMECKGGSSPIVYTSGGGSIQCENVVMATGTPTSAPRVQEHVIAAKIPKNGAPLSLFWDTSPSRYRVRFAPLDPANHWILVSGVFDHHNPKQYLELESWANNRWPAMGPVEHSWSYVANSLLPFVERLEPNVNFIYGGSSNATITATLCAKLVTNKIMHRESFGYNDCVPNQHFAQPPYTLWEAYKNNYLHWERSGDIPTIADIPPGTGAVLIDGCKHIAVYKNPDATVKTFSALSAVHICRAWCNGMIAIGVGCANATGRGSLNTGSWWPDQLNRI